MTTVAFKGTPIHLSGQFPRLGQMAPHFCLVDSMLQDKNLEDFSYSKKLLLIVPSLETSVCSTCTKTFHSKILKHPHVGFFVISADLPFAQKRYCETETILSQNLHPLSMMRDKSFGKDYGVLMEDGPLAG
ncbi:MAG: thiol peroxidase, partial [Chlamydiae bacterium]|nr:thiol peroxidase [Chlamydiota bacterium]